MHMQKGIGRAGYRLLALVFWTIGMLGLSATWYAYSEGTVFFIVAGLVMGVASLGFLLMFAFVLTTDIVLMPRPGTKPRSSRGPPKRRPDGATPKRAAAKTLDGEAVDFEFPEVDAPRPSAPPTAPGGKPAPAAPAAAGPSASRAPETLEMPDAFQAEPGEIPVLVEVGGKPAAQAMVRQAPDGSWPERRAPKNAQGLTHEEATMLERRQKVEAGEKRREMADRYTQGTPTVRKIVKEPASIPEVSAAQAPDELDLDWVDKDKMRGRCGQCGTDLLAPKQRPIKLRCPVCSKTTLLE